LILFKTELLYNAFKNRPNLKVYYKHEVPQSFHYNYNDRIGKQIKQILFQIKYINFYLIS